MKTNSRKLPPISGKKLTKKGIERQQKILKVAGELLIESGVENFTLTETARLAGISLGNVQYYFPHKRDLLHAFLCSHIDPGEEMVASAEERGLDADELLSEAIEYAIELGAQDEPCAVAWTMTSMALADQYIKELADQWFGSYQKLLIAILRRQNPSLSDSQVRQLSISIMSMIEGQALIWRHLTPGPRQREAAKKTLMEDINLLIESRRTR